MSDWDNPELGYVDDILRILGKRWTMLILKSMGAREAMRFTELKKALAGISGTMLSERLLELEREGLVAKKIYGAVPPKVEYRLTASARELLVMLKEIDRWRFQLSDAAPLLQ